MSECPRCGASKHKGRCKAANLAKVQRSPADAQPGPAPVRLNGHLEVAAGLGFRASIEDSALVIEQDRTDDDGAVYTHTLTLAPHEARQLVDWIADRVAQ